jgi:hypothetical protein
MLITPETVHRFMGVGLRCKRLDLLHLQNRIICRRGIREPQTKLEFDGLGDTTAGGGQRGCKLGQLNRGKSVEAGKTKRTRRTRGQGLSQSGKQTASGW